RFRSTSSCDPNDLLRPDCIRPARNRSHRRSLRHRSAVGDTLFIKGVPFTIIGVAAPAFDGVEHNTATDVWIPIQNRPELKPWGRPADANEGFYSAPTWWFL